jgi:hypothetical protein
MIQAPAGQWPRQRANRSDGEHDDRSHIGWFGIAAGRHVYCTDLTNANLGARHCGRFTRNGVKRLDHVDLDPLRPTRASEPTFVINSINDSVDQTG